MEFRENKTNSKLVNLHQGHRKRLRASLIENDFENVEDYIVLEYLLGMTNKRKDTNEIAHRLINEFGSLAKVLDAEIEDLVKIKDVGNITATFLHGVPSIFKAYKKSKISGKVDLSTTQRVVDYIGGMFNHMANEEFYIVCLDAQSRLINVKKLARGTNSEVKFNLKTITETAVRTNAQGIIILHNHPDGNSAPSMNDIEMTKQIFFNLYMNDVPLLDHIIVTADEKEYYSFFKNGVLDVFKNEYEKTLGKKLSLNIPKPKYE